MIKKIHKLLNENYIQHREIAEKMGVHRTLIQKYLSGDKKMTANMLYRICQALIEIAHEREVSSKKLKISVQEIMMDMGNSDSVSHM